MAKKYSLEVAHNVTRSRPVANTKQVRYNENAIELLETYN